VSSSNGWNTNFDNFVLGDPLPTPTPTASATPTPSVTPTITPTSTPTAATETAPTNVTIGFDDLADPNRPLSGQYPTRVIDRGSDGWYLSAPWGLFTTNSITFNGPLPSSASFTLLSPRRLIQVDAYNGGPDVSDIELSCDQVSLVQLQLGVRQLTTIVTGWTDVCTTVTVSSSNG